MLQLLINCDLSNKPANDETVQSKEEMTNVEKVGWLEKHLVRRKVRENEGKEEKMRNRLENNKYPKYLDKSLLQIPN